MSDELKRRENARRLVESMADGAVRLYAVDAIVEMGRLREKADEAERMLVRERSRRRKMERAVVQSSCLRAGYVAAVAAGLVAGVVVW